MAFVDTFWFTCSFACVKPNQSNSSTDLDQMDQAAKHPKSKFCEVKISFGLYKNLNWFDFLCSNVYNKVVDCSFLKVGTEFDYVTVCFRCSLAKVLWLVVRFDIDFRKISRRLSAYSKIYCSVATAFTHNVWCGYVMQRFKSHGLTWLQAGTHTVRWTD